MYQYPLNIGFVKGSSGVKSGGTVDFLLGGWRTLRQALHRQEEHSLSSIPKSNSESHVKPNPVFGWLVRSNLIEAEKSEVTASLA
ncbi:hypothetical protein [Paenibacillus sp. UASWS1643]|uniref:hypothetical protein n=1 Tax=Paenibacillus sp. UASWS1643 TaxID=2580422 RepID=UPI000F51E2FC|nr:hypothetical protein [Paenibacillus sp. UASWS1643]